EGDAVSGDHAARSEGALGNQLYLQLAAQELPLELGVLADVGCDHLPDLPAMQEQAEAEIVHTGVIGDAGKAVNAFTDQGVDTILGDAAKAEAAQHDGGAGLDMPDGLVGAGNYFIDHRMQVLLTAVKVKGLRDTGDTIGVGKACR